MSETFYSRDKVDTLLTGFKESILSQVTTAVDNQIEAIKAECVVEHECPEPDVIVADTTVVIGPSETTENIIKILKEFRNVQFSKGVIYEITAPLVVYSNSVIDLNGATLRREFGGAIMHAFVDPDETTGYDGVHDVVIKNGTLEGMNTKGYRATDFTAWMHCNNIRFEEVTFLDNPGYHCLDLVGCANVYIMNCKFLGYYSHGKDYAESIQIDNCAHLSLPSYPVGSACYDMTYCKNIVIDGCEFGASEDRPAQYIAIGAHSQGDDYNYHQDIVIRNCNATGNGHTGGDPSYGYFVRMMKMKNVLIENNKIGNYARAFWCSMPGTLYGADGTGVPASSNADKVVNVENLKIISNEIVSKGSTWQSYGFYIKDTFGKSKNIVVQDLNVPASAVYINGCENVLIGL